MQEFKNIGQHYKNIWQDKNLKPNEKLVLIYLIDYYNVKEGYCRKTRKQIEEGIGIHKDTLNRVLKRLEAKGYISIGKHKTKHGWNNIYYIHKYLVVAANDVSEGSKPIGSDTKPVELDAKVEADKQEENSIEEETSIPKTTNELLIDQKAKLRGKMSDLKKEAINELDTDILIQAIDRANKVKPQGYFIGYILSICDDIKKNMENNPSEAPRNDLSTKPTNNSSNEKKANRGANKSSTVKTKYHGTFNEHFRKYSDKELEEKLLKVQAAKRSIRREEES